MLRADFLFVHGRQGCARLKAIPNQTLWPRLDGEIVSWTGPQRSSKELGSFVEDADDNGANCISAFLALPTGFLKAGLTAGSAFVFSCCSCCWMSNF